MKGAAKGKPRVVAAAIMMCGTIIGAGIFALPHFMAQSGYAIGLFWMIVLAAAVTCIHLLFGEIAAVTKEDHGLVGYVGIYLGPVAKQVESLSSLLSLTGATVAYLILAGIFAQEALAPLVAVNARFGSLAMAVLGLLAAVYGTRFLLGIDSWMSWAEFAAFILLAVVSLRGFVPAHLMTLDISHAFLPYGVALFALGGIAAVPEVYAMTRGNDRARRRAIVLGTLLATGVTILFATAVLGATGAGTTPESLAGLTARFGGFVPLLAAVTGFLSIVTTYIVFTDYLKRQFRRDYRWPEWLSVLLAVGVPLGLFLAGVRDFGRILELLGAVLSGVEGIFIVLIYRIVRKKFPNRTLKMPSWVLWLLVAFYAAGAIYEIVFRLLL